MATKISFVFAACFVLSASALPVSQGPVVKESPQEILFRLQKPFEINCEVDGDASQVKYQWSKDNAAYTPRTSVEQKDGKLIFSEGQSGDEGMYQCYAVTPAGKASGRPIKVKQAFLKAPTVKTQTTKPVEGKPFKLSCAVPESYPKPTLEWKKMSADGKSESVSDQRITISADGDLYFTNATERDVSKDFKYVCVARSPAVDDEVILAEHTVEGLEPNPNPDNEVVQQYVTADQTTLKAGEQAYLYCIYGGTPRAIPDWSKDGKSVNGDTEPAKQRVTRHNRSKGKRLIIKEVLLEDQGQYTCVINNEVGKEQKYTFNVKVVSAPKFLSKPAPRVQVKEGEDLVIPCEVQALPAAVASWTYNAEALSNTRAAPDAKGLKLQKVQKSDSGYYGCSASNEHGKEYAETFLQVV